MGRFYTTLSFHVKSSHIESHIESRLTIVSRGAKKKQAYVRKQ